MDSSRESIVTMTGYKARNLHKVSPRDHELDLKPNQAWRETYQIYKVVEIYSSADLGRDPWFSDTMVFYEGFLRAGLYLPLRPLSTSFI